MWTIIRFTECLAPICMDLVYGLFHGFFPIIRVLFFLIFSLKNLLLHILSNSLIRLWTSSAEHRLVFQKLFFVNSSSFICEAFSCTQKNFTYWDASRQVLKKIGRHFLIQNEVSNVSFSFFRTSDTFFIINFRKRTKKIFMIKYMPNFTTILHYSRKEETWEVRVIIPTYRGCEIRRKIEKLTVKNHTKKTSIPKFVEIEQHLRMKKWGQKWAGESGNVGGFVGNNT